jgi:hypothetical protein
MRLPFLDGYQGASFNPTNFCFGAYPKDAAAEPLSSKHAVVFSGRTAAPLARALCVGKDTRVVEIHGSGEAMALASLNTIRSMAFSGLKQVTIVNLTINLRLLEALCEEFPGLTIDALLPRAISWKSDGFRYLKSLILLQQRYPQLNLLSYGASMRAFVTKLGGKVGDAQLGLPKPGLRPAPGPITVLISRGDSEIPSQGHIAAAVALAKRRLSDRIDKIVYEAGSSQVGRILETFGSTAQKVPSLDQYINESCGGPFVLVGPYPDGMTDSLALLALEKGGLALVAKGALPLTAPLEKWLTIDYWEQSDLICDRLCELTSNYAAVQNLLVQPSETRARVHKSDARLLRSPLA